MSRRTVSLSPAQQTFLDSDACAAISEPVSEQDIDDRPTKRRKVDPGADGWAAIVEFILECRFEDKASTAPSTSAADSESLPMPAAFEFEDPVLSVLHPDSEQTLFAFVVCREDETTIINNVLWLQWLAGKSPSVQQCLQISTSVSFRWSNGSVVSAVVSVVVKVRFDQNLSKVAKLSPKDRLAVIDFTFDKTLSEVTADQFYTKIGRLPSDYVKGVDDALLQHPTITCRLFPFQKRAVAWMLQREGKSVEGIRATVAPETQSSDTGRDDLPPLWETITDLDNRVTYLNRHQGLLSLDKQWVQGSFGGQKIPGGILAEEMGLGKTIEIIDLILMNPRPPQDYNCELPIQAEALRPSKATVIITPPTILSQWAGEFAERAPTLKVFIYPGVQHLSVNFNTDDFLDYDVILATYPILSKEIHYATPPPDRSMRYGQVHPARRSPLMEFSWWRVCLDEAQMIEGSVTSAATVACMLPRINAWCVSGTPCKRDVSDLYGLLVFLRYQPIAHAPTLWARVRHDWDVFVRIFRPLVCRSTKRFVKDEMALPPQTKAVLSVDFTAVEEINYQHIFEQMLDDCGLTPAGTPARQNVELNERVTEKMKKWLVRLRQACSHPGVGTWRSGTKEMKTMEEVLEKMYEDTCTAISRDERELFISRIKRGQIYDYNKEHNQALEIWAKVLEDVRGRASVKKAEVLELKNTANSDADSGSSDTSDEEDAEDERKAKKRRFLQTKRANELRDLQDLQHRATFMMASANFQLKNEEEETRLYDEAEKLRREILRHPIRKANHFIKRLNALIAEQQFVEIPEFRQSEFSGGILTRKVFERLQPLVDQMNEQANRMDEWREKIVQGLRLSLLDQTVDPNGEEYQAGLDVQEEASSYQEVLRQAVAGRVQVTSGFVNELVRDDILRQKNLGLELTALQTTLWKEREEIQPKLEISDPPLPHEFSSLKAAIDLLRSMVGTLSEDAVDPDSNSTTNWRRTEIAIAQTETKRLQQCLVDQNKANAALEKEVEFFRVVYNSRIEYYRQLQLVSDTLENYSGEDPDRDLHKLITAEAQLYHKIARNISRRRYLQELRSWESKLDQVRLCVICQSNFDVGALTKCGHLFCFACLQIWLKSHHTCPVCKERLTADDWHKIATKKADVVIRGTESSHQDHSFSQAIYEAVDQKVLQQIQLVELKTSFGSKIDNLTRHLLWIKEQGGAKAIVFSQWSDVLDVMERSFKINGIGYVRFDQKKRKDEDPVTRFKTSNDIQVFMLHSQSQSSGLSLIDATHCFLVEPLINSAIELQAVSRIHRMGQTKPTFVWLHTVNGTVEERVLDVSSRKRLASLQDAEASANGKGGASLGVQLDQSETVGLQQHVGKLLERRGVGEVVETGELWKCLFGGQDHDGIRQRAVKEVQREQAASAAEARQATTVMT